MMAYADLKDVNTHLPEDKLPMNEMNLNLELDAERIIRGYVGGVIPFTELQTWADPETTPELIRAIAGRLIAAAYYAERYAENSNEDSVYAQDLYNTAISFLVGIKAGTQVLISADGSEVESSQISFGPAFFVPNDATTPTPAFTRGQIFG